MQIAFTIFFLAWCFAVLGFLSLIYRATITYIHHMEETMVASRAISAEAALKSAEAANKLATMLEQEYHAAE